MAKMYVSWHKLDTPTNAAGALMIDGTIISAEVVDIVSETDSNAAPAYAEYANVWVDVNAYIAHGSAPTASSTTRAIPASAIIIIKGIIPGITKISGLAI